MGHQLDIPLHEVVGPPTCPILPLAPFHVFDLLAVGVNLVCQASLMLNDRFG